MGSISSPVLWIIVTAVAAFTCGAFFGMRLQLAKGRWRELRRGLTTIQNAESLEAAFAATLPQRASFEAAGLVHHVRFVNTIQFVLTWNWDLSTLLNLLDSMPEAWSLEAGWRRTLLARTLALSAYEALTKLATTFDPANNRKSSLRRALRVIAVGPAVEARLDGLHQEIEAVLAKHGELLEGIRNNVIGHRDLDVATQLLWMRKADANEIRALGYELLGLTTTSLQVLTGAISAIRNQPSFTDLEDRSN